MDRVIKKKAGKAVDYQKGRIAGEANTPEQIENQKKTRQRNIATGKPSTANGWKSPRALAAWKARREARKQ